MEINPDARMDRLEITSLPDSIIVGIFNNFSLVELCRTVRLVCQRWQELSFDMDLWKRVDLKDRNDDLTDLGLVQLLSQIGEHIEHLDLRFCSSVSHLPFYSNKVNCPNLKTIDITETQTPEQIQKVLFLDTEKFPVLESVTWESNEKISIPGFYQLYCDGYLVGRKFTTLTNPYPTGHNPDDPEDDVNPGLLKIAGLFKQLKALTVKRANIQGATLETLCKANPGIQTVIVPECLWLSDKMARNLSHLTALTELNISGTAINDTELFKTVSHHPGLRKINISACSRITDVGIIKVAETCRDLTHFIVNELQHHTIGTITDNSLCTIGVNCHKLRALSLNSCPQVTDIGIQALTVGCTNLEYIDVAKCTGLTNASFLAMAEDCPELRTLKASECVKISSLSVNALVKQCTKLQELELDTCFYLSKLQFSEPPMTVLPPDDVESISIDDSSHQSTGANYEPAQNPSPRSTPVLACEDNEQVLDSSQQSLPEPNTRATVHSSQQSISISNDDSQPLEQSTTTIQHSSQQSIPSATSHDNPPIQYSIQDSLISSPCRLRVLDLSYCSNIATDSVRQIAAFCVTLRHLSLRGCFRITDKAIEAVAIRCRLLSVLDISGSSTNTSRLTDRALASLSQHARNLSMLALTKTSLGTSAIIDVIHRCRTLRRIKLEAGGAGAVNVDAVIKAAGAERSTCRVQGHGGYDVFTTGPVMLAMPPLQHAI